MIPIPPEAGPPGPPSSSQGDRGAVEGRPLIAELNLLIHELLMSRRGGRARALPPGPANGYGVIRQKVK
jgi:hypothetical protein